MKIAPGRDEAGYALKEILKPFIVAEGHEVDDFGTYDTEPVLYPDIGHAVATAVAAGKCESAVRICGTGIGMAIAANKEKGVRASQRHDAYSAERARRSNNAQIVMLGARVIGPELANASSSPNGSRAVRASSSSTSLRAASTSARRPEAHALLNALARDGVSIIVVSSDPPEILAISGRIVVLKAGRVNGELSRANATQERVMLAATS
jgi:ribose 5-phosphate isomerase B